MTWTSAAQQSRRRMVVRGVIPVLYVAALCMPGITFAQQSPHSQPAKEHRPVPVKPDRAPPVSRADLAQAYLLLDRWLVENPQSGQRLAEINKRFDAASLLFFANRLEDAVREISALTASLAPENLRGRLGVVVATPDPPVYSLDEPTPATIRLNRIGVQRDGSHGKVPTRLQVIDAQSQVVADVGAWVEPVADSAMEMRIDVVLAPDAVPGMSEIVLKPPEGETLEVGRWPLVGSRLDPIRRANATALDEIARAGKVRPQSIACCAARNRLLNDAPSTGASAQFLVDLARLQREVASEISELRLGHDPYQQRDGDTWRVLTIGKQQIPFRVYAPPQRDRTAKLPLVVALHGAGGDENMFFEGYGQGVIRRLAEEKGFIVVSPLTYPIAGDAAMVDALIDEITSCYTIDPDRISLVGHSLGGMAARGLALARRTRLASVCRIAGGGVPRAREIAPTLVIAAENDALAGADAAERGLAAATSAQALGVPVEYRIMNDWGHTLVVGAALPEAIDWMLSKRLAR